MRKSPLSAFLTLLLNVSWYGLAIVLALTVCLTLLSLFTDFQENMEFSIPVSFSVDAEALQVSAPSLGVATAQIEDVRGSLTFPPPPGRSFVTPGLFFVIATLSLMLWVLGQLRAVFRTLRDGRPFVPANATRIRWVAFVVIFGELARTVLVFFTNSFAATHFSANGLRFEARPDLNLFAIVNGLIILAIAQVFREGARLDEDQSLTI